MLVEEHKKFILKWVVGGSGDGGEPSILIDNIIEAVNKTEVFVVITIVFEWEGCFDLFFNLIPGDVYFISQYFLGLFQINFQVKSCTYHFFHLGRNLFLLVGSLLCNLS